MFVRGADGMLQFHPAEPLTDAEVQWVVVRVRRQLARLGVTGAAEPDGDGDPLAEESVALAGLAQAAVVGRAAMGRRAGRGPQRIGLRELCRHAAARSRTSVRVRSRRVGP